MKFGKLSSIENVDFSLAPDAKGTSRLLDSFAPNTEKAAFYIGATGWGMKEWVGKYYPKNTKAKDYLKAYGKQFNTIEFNTTHYRTPTLSNVQKWVAETPEDFVFCPKMLKWVSHTNDLGFGSGNLIDFCESIMQLGAKLGQTFMQLPPYFGPSRMKILKQFLKNFPKHIPLAIEFRHKDWFENTSAFTEAFDMLESYGIGTVITDVAGRRDVLHQRLTTNTVMIRFVGNGLHATDYERIDAWMSRLDSWIKKGVRTIYFFPHEPDNLLSPEIAEYVLEKAKMLNVAVRGPQLISQENKQISLF